MAAKNPFVGMHPDLFASQHPQGAPTGKSTKHDLQRAEAWKRGETPMFVELDELTPEQIRELPRSAFSNDEWLKLDEDDREYIEENDAESQGRVNDLASPFIQAYTYAQDPDDDSVFAQLEDGFEQYLSDNASKMYEEMPTERLDKLVQYGSQRGVSEDEVIEAINAALVDTNNYEFGLSSSSGSSIYSEEIHASAYVERDEWSSALKAATPDEVKRAIDRVRKSTDGAIDLTVKDFSRSSYDTDWDTGHYARAYVNWDAIDILVRDAIDDIEIPDTRDMPGAKPPEQRVVYRWRDGFYVQDLLPSELPAEGKTMGMCVGREDMGYGKAVREGEAKILSLRRPSGKPLFTIEASTSSDGVIESIDQIKGKANRKPGFDLGKDTDIYAETIGPKGLRQMAIAAIKRDEVERVLEYLDSINIEPLSVQDLHPALFAINDLRNREDPWATKIANRTPGFAKVEDEARYTEEPPQENPACDHGKCTGFCVPYRRRVRNPPMQGKRYEEGAGAFMYSYGWRYAYADSKVLSHIKSLPVEDLLVVVDALQEGKVDEGLSLLKLTEMDRAYRLENITNSEWQRGYKDGVLDMVERQTGLRENPPMQGSRRDRAGDPVMYDAGFDYGAKDEEVTKALNQRNADDLTPAVDAIQEGRLDEGLTILGLSPRVRHDRLRFESYYGGDQWLRGYKDNVLERIERKIGMRENPPMQGLRYAGGPPMYRYGWDYGMADAQVTSAIKGRAMEDRLVAVDALHEGRLDDALAVLGLSEEDREYRLGLSPHQGPVGHGQWIRGYGDALLDRLERLVGMRENPPIQGQRKEEGPSRMYEYGWSYGLNDMRIWKAMRLSKPDELMIAIDALQEGRLEDGLEVLGLEPAERAYRILINEGHGGDAEWLRGYRDGILDLIERKAGMRENPHRDRSTPFGRRSQQLGIPLNSYAAEHGSAIAMGQLNNLVGRSFDLERGTPERIKPAWSRSAIETLRVAGDAVDEGDRDTALGLLRQVSGEFDGLRPSDGWKIDFLMVRDAVHSVPVPHTARKGGVKETLAAIRATGASVKRVDGEWQINIPGGTDETTYFTNDAEDALATARAMMRMTSAAPLEGRAFEDYLISYWMAVLMAINEDDPWKGWFGGLPGTNPTGMRENPHRDRTPSGEFLGRVVQRFGIPLNSPAAEHGSAVAKSQMRGVAGSGSAGIKNLDDPHPSWSRNAIETLRVAGDAVDEGDRDTALGLIRQISGEFDGLRPSAAWKMDFQLVKDALYTNKPGGPRDLTNYTSAPFAGRAFEDYLISYWMEVLMTINEDEPWRTWFGGLPETNPAGLTAKGERMYTHIKEAHRGDPRAKEIAARTVYARASEGVPGLRNPTMTRDEAIDQFMKLLLDTDPAAMEIAQDLALENKLSLADLGEISASSARRSGTVRSAVPPTGLFLLAVPPKTVGPSALPFEPPLYSGWELNEIASQRSWASQQPEGTHHTYLLRYTWHGLQATYPRQGYAGRGAFRTAVEARRAAAADAWAVAKLLKSTPTIASTAEVYELINSTIRGQTPDTTPPELYEHKTTRKPKRPTYVEAQDAAIDAMRRVGWTPSGMLKVRHVTSPSGRIRLWFKPQSVYVSSYPQQATPGVHRLGDAHSMSGGLPDLRDLAGPQFVDEIRRRFPYEFPRG